MTDDLMIAQMRGEIVAKSFAPTYVVLSYMVSWVGAWTSLELLNKRTAGRGLYNWYLLIGSSISEGGISIWSMHFLANRAILLGDGRNSLQISYSSAFTALSFFVPTVVLLGAFITAGSNEKVSWLRVCLGGTLAGTSIAGMHFVAQAGISNYSVEYVVINAIGSGIHAVVVSIIALTVFLILRATWTASWWIRALTAAVLAGGASSMHWLAEIGTQYRLMKISDGGGHTLSSDSTIIIVIVLSVSACVLLLISSLLAQRRRALSADRAQQVVLAAAIFDKVGRLMVTPEGRLPSQKVTDSFMERSFEDIFGISHPVFLWIFRITRHWESITALLPLMRSHIDHTTLPNGLRSRKGDFDLASDSGEPIEDFSIVFRELFCVAASDLADQLNEPLEQVGVLFDEILTTGRKGQIMANARKRSPRSSVNLELSGLEPQYYGRGQLLFLTRKANQREVENLQNTGFRFASIRNVVDILARSMQISTEELSTQLNRMCDYSTETKMLEPGVHTTYFAIRANVRGGFDVLVRKNARNQLPMIRLRLPKLDDWHQEYLSQLDGMSALACLTFLTHKSALPNLSERETTLVTRLRESFEALRDDIRDPTFLDSLFVARPLSVPCHASVQGTNPGQASVIAFRMIVPIHSQAPNDQFEFIPLAFFKAQQHIYPNSPGHAFFSRRVHRELAPILNQSQPSMGDGESGRPHSLGSFNIQGAQSVGHIREELEYRMPTLIPRAKPDNRKLHRFWGKNLQPPQTPGSRASSSIRDDASSEKNLVETTSFGGILVSQEITVDIQEITGGVPQLSKSAHVEMMHSSGDNLNVDEKMRMGTHGMASTETEDPETYVDNLFAICKESR